MREPPEARLNAADDDGHIGIELAQAIAVDDRRALRPVAGAAARRIRILMADFLGRRELVEQRIHIARGNKEPQPRLSQAVEVLGGMPVWLGNDTNLIPMFLEETADDGRTEARVIDIGIPRDEDKVKLLPAAFFHVAA